MVSIEVWVKLITKKPVVENLETLSPYPNLALLSFKVCPLFRVRNISYCNASNIVMFN
jgi:hypothetical protein